VVVKFAIFIALHLYILNTSVVYFGVERRMFKGGRRFQYMTNISTPKNRNPYSGVIKFTIWGESFLLIINTHVYLVCLLYAHGYR
jgi:hypothetical protein